jgi:uncharacterized damage-inducible protein DinB
MKLEDFFSNYFTVRAELVKAVEKLTPEQLAWKAPDYPNTLGWLPAHIAETEYWWITVVALEKDKNPDWDRFGESKPIHELLTMLDETFRETESFLQSDSIEDWDRVFFQIPNHDEKVSLCWLVWHVVEHQARHRGQIFMLMRMQGIEVPSV